VALLGALGAAAVAHQGCRPRPQPRLGPSPDEAEALRQEGVEGLARLLRRAGLALHLTCPYPHKGTAFLTEGARPAEVLRLLPSDPSQAARWRGVVRVEVGSQLGLDEELIRQRGAWYWRWGPFHFFGDPELLAKVRAALEGE
jgi:hypothetical protein